MNKRNEFEVTYMLHDGKIVTRIVGGSYAYAQNSARLLDPRAVVIRIDFVKAAK
jgi:hypothetical protein